MDVWDLHLDLDGDVKEHCKDGKDLIRIDSPKSWLGLAQGMETHCPGEGLDMLGVFWVMQQLLHESMLLENNDFEI